MSVEALDNISCPIAPVADSHLANKAYVDAAVASGAGTASGSGDNVVSIPATSLISCGLAPTEDSHLANKAYVDAAVAAAGSATPIEEPAALGRVVYVDTLSDAASHTGTSLRDAISAVTDKGSVVIKFSVSGTITLEQGEIVIPVGNIAIDGENKVTISGNNASRVFALSNANTVLRLCRLTITGGNGAGAANSKVYGGAILLTVNSVLEARDVTFSGNSVSGTAATVGGGAVGITAGRAYFTGCSFNSNSSITSGSTCGGGAIYNNAGAALLHCVQCTFTGNTVSAGTTATGGAVKADAGMFEDCVFAENSVVAGTNRQGGAVSVSGHATIQGCMFTGNTVGTQSGQNGGAIALYDTYYVRITDCEFIGNSGFCGGAVCIRSTTTRSPAYYAFARCIFDNNSSGSYGAAIYCYCKSATIEDCEFKNHEINANGIIYTYGYTNQIHQVTVNRCKFTGNSTTNTTNGLIYCANYADVYVYNSVFTGNSAETAGVNVALLYTTGNSTLTAGNLTMTDNEKFRSFRAASGSISIYNSVDVGNVAVPSITNVTAISMLSNWNYGAGRIAYDSSKPLFAADGFTPVAGSQVIDAGDDDYVETVYDLVGKARVSGASVDVGAVEWQSS